MDDNFIEQADWAVRLTYLETHLAKIRKVVEEQAAAIELWAIGTWDTVEEACLRQELRRLHAVIEGD